MATSRHAGQKNSLFQYTEKDYKNEVTNYRGITLLSALGKVFTRILNNRLNSWAETYGVYVEAQSGFHKNMSTIDYIFKLKSLISHFLNRNEYLYCIFIEFAKAFDYVVRDVIWYKLLKLDYQVSICSLIFPATAIRKTQDRADTGVWWKLPFSIFVIIYYVQSAIINKVCKPELRFLCSAHPIIVLYICMKFHENISNNFRSYRADICI